MVVPKTKVFPTKNYQTSHQFEEPVTAKPKHRHISKKAGHRLRYICTTGKAAL